MREANEGPEEGQTCMCRARHPGPQPDCGLPGSDDRYLSWFCATKSRRRNEG